MKTFTTLSILLVLCTQQAFAQVFDDFKDEEFLSNPAWSGNTSKFTVVANQLKLQAPAVNGNAYLSTVSTVVHNASWEFLVKFTFNPSSANYARVYLISDNVDISGTLSGYYVLIGDTQRDISLYRQSESGKIKIIDGQDDAVNAAQVNVKIKVTRDASGNWELFSDVGANNTYRSEGTVNDNTHQTSSYFGIFCAYTSTRSDKFFFDDITVTGSSYIDNTAPQCKNVTATSLQTLEVDFDEPLDVATAENVSNYTVSNDIGHPSSAKLSADLNKVSLFFTKPFQNGIEETIKISEIKDVVGNTMTLCENKFLFFQPVSPQFKSIIISEIFADPSPVVGLPEAEFVELFNRSSHSFDLKGWTFTDGSLLATLPSIIIHPGQYYILCHSSRSSNFALPGRVVLGVSNFPTLNNAGDFLVLKDQLGNTIDSVAYTDDWYKDEEKKEGGWSLELIDPQNLCVGATNWMASEDNIGGTPGKENSIHANKPDLTKPQLLFVMATSENLIKLKFNEPLEKLIPSTKNFQLEPFNSVLEVKFPTSTLDELELTLSAPLEKGQRYTLKVEDVYDCSGNIIDSKYNTSIVALAELAVGEDIVINEVLFNPTSTGVDFVEVYNRSAKFINVKNWSISNIENDTLKNLKSITDKDFLLAPASYLLLTTGTNIVKGEYIASNEMNFLQVKALPSLNDDEGTVALIDHTGNSIDQFQYSDKMHSPFIKDKEGVSLERLDFFQPTNSMQNWKSASSSSGFATPGYINSQTRPTATALFEEAIKIEPEVFHPLSGQSDFAQIKYRFDKGGFVANVAVLDSQGRKIKEIANNEILGAEGFFRWDGDQENGSKARTGYYMIWFEIFDETGSIKTFRKRVAIAGNFN
jgi:hypothetical protein